MRARFTEDRFNAETFVSKGKEDFGSESWDDKEWPLVRLSSRKCA